MDFTKPQRSYSFLGFEQALGNDAFPGQELDVQIDQLIAAEQSTQDFLSATFRADGKLKGGSVGRDQLGPDVQLGFNPPASWAAGVSYSPPDTAFNGSVMYSCLEAHVSDASFAVDLAAGRWFALIDFGQSAGEAATARDEAEAARDLAQTYRDEAQGHRDAAAASETAAATSASDAQSSEDNANAYATAALDHRDAAAASAAAALVSQNGSKASLDEFKGVWLGVQPADPAVDLLGDPLTGGELYLNSVSGLARTYNTVGGWRDVGSSADVRHGTITTDGSAGPYTLPTAPLSKYTVFANMNGNAVLWQDYEVAGNELTFNYTPPAGLEVDFAVLGTVDIGVPSVETVAFPQLTTDVSELALMRQALTASGEKPFRWNHAWNPFMKLNTRGQASYGANGYTLDRWSVTWSGGIGGVTQEALTRGEDGMPFEILHYMQLDVTTGGDYCRLEHKWPSARQFAGKTITVVFLARGVNPGGGRVLLSSDQYFGAASATPTRFTVDSENIVLNPTWTLHAVKLDIPDISGVDLKSDSYISVRVGQGVDASTDAWRLDITGFMVFEGDVRDEFTELGDVTRHYRGDGVEEHRCQVFCRRVAGVTVRGQTAGFYYQVPVGLSPKMWRVPDIAYSFASNVGSWSGEAATAQNNLLELAARLDTVGGSTTRCGFSDILLDAEI